MNTPYKTETIEQHGAAYRVEWFYDDAADAPWDNSDGHGPVTDWERRNKKPGEFILSSDRGCHRFYDFAEAIRIAKRDGWNTAPFTFSIKGEQAHAAVMADFEYLRRWCDDQWHYCGIVVTLLDDDGEATDIYNACWGIEEDGYCSAGYHATII